MLAGSTEVDGHAAHQSKPLQRLFESKASDGVDLIKDQFGTFLEYSRNCVMFFLGD